MFTSLAVRFTDARSAFVSAKLLQMILLSFNFWWMLHHIPAARNQQMPQAEE